MALLRAIVRARQVLGSIIGESLVIGVIASAIGVLGGIALALAASLECEPGARRPVSGAGGAAKA